MCRSRSVTYATNDEGSPLLLERKAAGSTIDQGVTVTMWPSAFVGLRIAR